MGLAAPSSLPEEMELPEGFSIEFDYSDRAQPLALAKGEGLIDTNQPLRFIKAWWQGDQAGWASVEGNHQRVEDLSNIDRIIQWLNTNNPDGAPRI